MIQEVIVTWPDAVGIIGVILILIAYYFLNIHKWHATDESYQWLNLWGSILILVSLFYSWNLSSVIIEIAWFIISIIGLKKIYQIKKAKKGEKI